LQKLLLRGRFSALVGDGARAVFEHDIELVTADADRINLIGANAANEIGELEFCDFTTAAANGEEDGSDDQAQYRVDDQAACSWIVQPGLQSNVQDSGGGVRSLAVACQRRTSCLSSLYSDLGAMFSVKRS